MDTIRVSAGIIVHDGMLLIAKRRPTAVLPNAWVLPGGRVEEHETPEACLKRELKEEFAIGVTVHERVGSHVHTYDFGTVELIAFRADWDDGDFNSREHEEIRWAFPHELDQFNFAPADHAVIQRIMSGDIDI